MSGFRQAPDGLTVELDYGARTDYQPVYLGTAAVGTALTTPSWAIRYLQYDGSARLVSIANAVGAWSQRATLTYV